jgi:3-hydroxybutyryl-CoA dehydratase
MVKDDTYTHVFEVTETVYNGFLSVFNDRNPLHTDDSFAQSKGFRNKVMHGNILNGFLSFMIGECLPDKNVMIHSQTIDYKKPVYLGDKLEMTATIKDVHESVNAAEIGFTFTNQDGVKVAKGKIQIGFLK